MNGSNKNILTINGGSTSIKFALYSEDDKPIRKLHGKIDRMGLNDSTLSATDAGTNKKSSYPVNAKGITEAAVFLINWLEEQTTF